MSDQLSTALVPLASTPAALAVYEDPALFEHYQRVANLFAKAELVPAHLRGKVADCFIGVCIAREMGVSPVMVLQNIYFVGGRAGWATQFMIARANTSGKFRGPLRWREEGAGDKLAVTCFADLARVEGESRVEVTVDMAMAKAEGWTKNAKYNSIPSQMLRWRSATWLIRLYAPEVMMGIPAQDELEDITAAGQPQRAHTGPARTASAQLDGFAASPMLEHEPEQTNDAGHGDASQPTDFDPKTGEVFEGQADQGAQQSEPAPADPAPADDWELELEQLQEGARACKTLPDLNAYKIEVGKRLQALPEAVFERWQSFSKTLATELRGAK